MKIKNITYNLVFTLLSLVFLTSCEKPEEPIAPATVQGQTAYIGPEYRYQEYYNVLKNEFVLNQDHFGWDLNFESSESGSYIFLNSSNFMTVRNAGVVAFESVTDTNYSALWKYDFPTGETHKTSFGKWFNSDLSSKNEVFIVNQGKDIDGFDIGIYKCQILSVTAADYKIRVARLDNTADEIITLNKNPDKRWIQYHFGESITKELEPDSENWHLLFTQYTDYDITTGGDTIPYLVRGALLNSNNIQAVLVENVDFKNITKDLIPQLDFSSHLNAIGYKWKYFSLDTGVYTIKEGMSYVIQEKNGTYFKLRFLGFYNEDGQKGYPSFEIISL